MKKAVTLGIITKPVIVSLTAIVDGPKLIVNHAQYIPQHIQKIAQKRDDSKEADKLSSVSSSQKLSEPK